MPMSHPKDAWRPCAAEFVGTGLFGAVGALITVSPIGKVSGAHINPIVTSSFVVRRRMRPFLGSHRLRGWTPLVFPPLYAVMVFAEAPVSGSSTNPARSLGPAAAADVWQVWRIYVVGPLAGALIGVAISRLPLLRTLEVEIAKVYHFDHDPHGLLRWHPPFVHHQADSVGVDSEGPRSARR